MRIRKITSIPVAIPYLPPVGPYQGGGKRNITGPGTTGARALVVKIETEEGATGWGDGIGSFNTNPDELLKRRETSDIEGALTAMDEAGIDKGPMSGVEMAMWDLVGKEAGLPLFEVFGGAVRDTVDFCGCMGIKEPPASADAALEYIDRWGFRFIKTKAGNSEEQDLSIARAIVEAISDRATLRPDANSGYSPEEAEPVVRQLVELGVPFFEDPCAPTETEALSHFRNDLGMKILVNAGVGTSASVLPVLTAGVVDYLMPDTVGSGGLLPVRKVATVAEAFGIDCLMHCAHDLGLKTASITHIAAATPNFSGPNDTCYHGLSDDILTEPLRFENGAIRVPNAPGLGVEVDESKVEKYSSG